MERWVKIRDFRDISLPAENINNVRKPRDLILKTANLDNTLNLDDMVLAQKYLIPECLRASVVLKIFYHLEGINKAHHWGCRQAGGDV